MKKIFFAAILGLFTTQCISAQESERPRTITGSYGSIENNETQTKPAFPGGINAFNQYVVDNLKLKKSKYKGLQKLLVTFVVERDGTVTNVKVKKGLDEETDKELSEVIKNSPKWSAGIINGKPTRASFSFPLTINFK